MDDVELAPEGDNPDVRCSVRGLRWGLECKIIYSTNPRRQIETLGDKVEQIQKSPVERGVVAVNVSALLDHSPLLTPNANRTRFEVDQYLKAEVDRVMDQIDTPSLQNQIRDRQTDALRSKLAGFYFLAESATVIEGRLAIPRYGLGLLLEDPPSVPDLAFHNRLQLGMR